MNQINTCLLLSITILSLKLVNVNGKITIFKERELTNFSFDSKLYLELYGRGENMLEYKIDVIKELDRIGVNTTIAKKTGIFGQTTMKKFREKDTSITLDNLNRLCAILEMQPRDIIKYVETEVISGELEKGRKRMLDKYQLTLEENIFLAKRNIVDSIYKESKLEGIAITFPETNEICEGRAVAGMSVDDIVKVNNLKHAWEFVLETVEYPIDLRYIRQLSQIIGDKIVPLAGELRSSDVNIGGTTWKPEIPDMIRISDEVHNIMNQDTSITEKAITLMLFLMRSQIFYDGNKRVAQLAANQVMIQNGKGIISIPVEHQEQFFVMLVKYYETNQMDEIKQFVYESSVSGINFQKKMDAKPVSKEEFYRKKVKLISPKL